MKEKERNSTEKEKNPTQRKDDIPNNAQNEGYLRPVVKTLIGRVANMAGYRLAADVLNEKQMMRSKAEVQKA